MWEVVNHTPFAATGAFERDRDGKETWCVAVRASFDLAGGIPAPLEDQEDVRLAPVYGGAAGDVLLAETDMAAFQPGTDVLLAGTARPPRSGAKTQLLELSVGPLTKRALLHGPRLASRRLLGWSLDEDAPVAEAPLDWTASFGGVIEGENGPIWCEENPLGMGIALWANRYDAPEAPVALPLIDRADGDILDDPRTARPVGFGPVSRHWQPRRDLAGTYDAAWEAKRAPKLPQDFDPRFYQSAPLDQVVPGHLKGGETMTLSGFTPDGTIAFRLPQIVLSAQTRTRGGREDSRFRLTRVEFDLDTRRLGMCWVTSVDCKGDDSRIQATALRLQQMAGVTA